MAVKTKNPIFFHVIFGGCETFKNKTTSTWFLQIGLQINGLAREDTQDKGYIRNILKMENLNKTIKKNNSNKIKTFKSI